MPSKPLRPCRHRGCTALVRGGYCTEHTAPPRERAPDNRPAAHLRGYDSDWNALRDWFIIEHPFCAACGRVGAMVDHVQPIDTHPERRLDPDNLQTLCNSCHRRKTARDKAQGDKARVYPLG